MRVRWDDEAEGELEDDFSHASPEATFESKLNALHDIMTANLGDVENVELVLDSGKRFKLTAI